MYVIGRIHRVLALCCDKDLLHIMLDAKPDLHDGQSNMQGAWKGQLVKCRSNPFIYLFHHQSFYTVQCGRILQQSSDGIIKVGNRVLPTWE